MKSKQSKNISHAVWQRRVLFLGALSLSMMVQAQKIDLDQSGRNTTEVTMDNFSSWQVNELTANQSETKTFGNVKVTIQNSTSAYSLRSGWYKAAIANDKLINDGIHHDGSPKSATSITVTISGLSNGTHTLQAYHNNPEGLSGMGSINVAVNGTKQTTVTPTSRAANTAASAKSYVTFSGTSATITYSSSTDFFINSLELDVTNADVLATSPSPADNDLHANADGGSIWLNWKVAASGSEGQKLYWGTDKNTIANGGGTCINLNSTSHSRQLTGLSPLKTYYWRIDNTKNGIVYRGEVWTFQPRRLAFPGAEGYGKWAIGGRGGQVYHVTSLADDGSYGTFRYGVTQLSGPRTIVFDVGGVITLKERLTINDPYITIAGQTAPGRGIMFKSSPLGVASDGITRFIRLRLGGGDSWSGSGANANTSDGMGMAGNNHAIMDHCSIGWAIDEGFSSRNSRNLTLQHTLISEELNYAGHSHYVEQSGRYVEHGYAATIGGGYPDGVGSYHHNLLAHNNGRNWSMSGGLSDGAYAGALDIFNNVCYNWGDRTTDGGTHEGNFVNNYYKMGPASTEKYLLTADLEGTGTGTQSYYVAGNIRENTDGSKTTNQSELRRQRATNGQVVNWTVFQSAPFFDSYATIESAEAAYKNVLSDVGCNLPELDNHDQRMVKETLSGSYSKTGYYTGKKGLIDRESDAEGFGGLNITTASRPSNWDTDKDGMPDWWEKAYGTNANSADHNSDLNGDNYTNLEEYLNWMADPHFTMSGKITIDLATYFAGYTNARYQVVACAEGAVAGINGSTLTVYNGTASALFTVQVKATQDGVSLTRTFNFYVDGASAGQQTSGSTATATLPNVSAQNGVILWPFEQGVAHQLAVVGDDLKNYVTTDVTIGSGLTYGGVKELNDLTETRIGVTVDNNPAPDDNNKLSFNIVPLSGYSLNITRIDFTATRIGTDGGNIDVSWCGNKIASGLRPARNAQNPEYTTYCYNVTTTNPEKGHKLTFNVYNLGITKQMAFANIKLYGTISQTANAKSNTIDNAVTGIVDVQSDASVEEKWYTLSGVRIKGPTQSGIYILNGKKVSVKK